MANKNAHVLLGGDFNCGDVEWSTMQVPEGVPQRPVQSQLLEIIKYHCLSQVVKIPTRNDRMLGPPGSNWCFSFAPELVGYSAPRDLHRRAAYSICESWFLIHQDVYHDLFVCSL